MVHRFFDKLHMANKTFTFDAYLMSRQHTGLSGLPTVAEAKRDYQAALRPLTRPPTVFMG